MRSLIVISAILLMTGCATTYKAIPDNYVGPKSTIHDSYKNKTSTDAHYFVLDKIDGKNIEDSWVKTRVDNHGRGMYFVPSIIKRDVMPVKQQFHIRGMVFFPTDFQLMMGDDLGVRGIVEFSPEPSSIYTVKGSLSEEISKVWIEDESGNVVGDVISKAHKK